MDYYFKLACEAAREFERRESGFLIENKKQLPQGKTNRIVSGYYNNEPVVFKFYTEPHSNRRKCRESLFLKIAAATGVVPKLLFESDRFIIIEKISGCSLEQKLSQSNLDFNNWLPKVAMEIGSAHATLANLLISEEHRSYLFDEHCGRKTLEHNIEEVLSASLIICREVEAFQGLENTVEYIKEHLGKILDRPRILYKYDNNFTNIIVSDRGFQKFIDFEDCYEGTKATYLGAIFDCLHQMPWNVSPNELSIYQSLPWQFVKRGYELQANEPIDSEIFKQVIAMAIFNAWLRVVRTKKAVPDLSFWSPRFRKRLDTYREIIAREIDWN